jgi:hypothetical protein
MTTAPTARATGSSGESRPSGASAAVTSPGPIERPAAGSPVVPVAAAAARPGSTRVPTPSIPAGTAKPQSSSSTAWSAARSGAFSVSIRLTTSRRPFRSAAVTKVCRAASVKPVFAPRSPSYVVSSGFWLWI